MDQQSRQATGRFDLYGPPHKCIRHAHGSLLTKLGKADFSRKHSHLLDELRLHLRMVAQHLAEENNFIHPVLERRAPRATSRLVTQHDEHGAFFGRLDGLIVACQTKNDLERRNAGRELYLTFGQFVANDLAHMDEEEQATWPLLCAHFSDDELLGIEQKIAADYTQEALLYFLPHLAAAATFDELASRLVGLKAAIPSVKYAELFSQAIEPALDEERRVQVRENELMP